MPNKNGSFLDDILARLNKNTEKTAEEILADNLAGSTEQTEVAVEVAPEVVAPAEEVVVAAPVEEVVAEVAAEVVAVAEPEVAVVVEDGIPEEVKTAQQVVLNYEKAQAEKTAELTKQAAEQEAIEKEELIKQAAQYDAQGRIMARAFYDEIQKLSATN